MSKILADSGDFKITQPTGFGVTGQSANAEAIVQTVVTNAVITLFTVGGIGVLVMFVWGAAEWILSGGDKEKVANARKRITAAIIGLVLLSLSYFIIGLIGDIVGFNPLKEMQIRGLGNTGPAATQPR